jgi:hypothetical protein
MIVLVWSLFPIDLKPIKLIVFSQHRFYEKPIIVFHKIAHSN